MEPFFSNIRTAASTNQSFVYIVPDDDIELYEHLLIDSGLDYDMIKGVLGAVLSDLFITHSIFTELINSIFFRIIQHKFPFGR